MGKIVWAIITGEYPPQVGGVGDYTRQVACHLASAGESVHIFAPAGFAEISPDSGVSVHRLPDYFGWRGLKWLGRQLDALPRPLRVLVQYVPHAYGYKAMNVLLVTWLWSRKRLHPVDLMFHEVAYGFERGQPFRRNVLAAVNWMMAAIVARSADRIFISIPAWERMLRPMIGSEPKLQWLPIPANVPTRVPEQSESNVRTGFGVGGQDVLIGHFGTYGGPIMSMLEAVLPKLLENPDRHVLLIGKDGARFEQRMQQAFPNLAPRIHATGLLPAEDLGAHLTACDLLLQPYPDGISSRRTSSMAGLALGVPIISCSGALTEPIWQESGAIALAENSSSDALVQTAEKMLADPALRAQVGARGQALYESRFAIEHTIKVLLDGVHSESKE